MMKTPRAFTALAVGTGLLTLVAASAAPGASPQHRTAKALSPFGHAMQMSTFYVGDVGTTGEFPGRLLCLHTGRQFIPAPVDQCAKKDHVYVLSMQDGSMVHPLLAGDPQTLEKLPRLVGKKVVVDGKYYESVGMVVAGNIRPRG
jgi:hypothetical protein